MKRYVAFLFNLLILTALLAACAPATHRDSADMEHGVMGDENTPYDALFIDSMIEHHQGAVEMSRQALEQATQPELRALAEVILADQEIEIAQMRAWRESWYPDVPLTEGMHIDMGPMEVAEDASKPYDLRFIEAMIPHHVGAVVMAQDALQNATRPEIRDLAQAIIVAQEAEIAQMQAWRLAWYGE